MADCPRCQKEFDPHGTGDSQYFLYECERPYNCLLDKAERKEVMQKDANKYSKVVDRGHVVV